MWYLCLKKNQLILLKFHFSVNKTLARTHLGNCASISKHPRKGTGRYEEETASAKSLSQSEQFAAKVAFRKSTEGKFSGFLASLALCVCRCRLKVGQQFSVTFSQNRLCGCSQDPDWRVQVSGDYAEEVMGDLSWLTSGFSRYIDGEACWHRWNCQIGLGDRLGQVPSLHFCLVLRTPVQKTPIG